MRPARLLLPVVAVLIAGALALVASWRREPPRAPLVLGPPPAPVTSDVNVVLVIGCTVRADETTPYGGSTLATPFLDELARQGTRFDTTIAQAPWTRPGVAALLTGRHPISIGLTEPGSGLNDRPLPESVVTLAEVMKASGRTTLGLTANPNASEDYGFAQGFDRYWDAVGRWRDGAAKTPGEELVSRALSQVAEADGPFYLQLLLIDAHQPDTSGFDRLRFAGSVPSQVAGYRAMLRDLDDSLRALDRGLRALGHDERDTVFVFVADHGEGLSWPSHHGPGHGHYLYPSSVHVPMVMRGPGVTRGHVVQGVSGQIDLLPTLADHLGLDVPAHVEGHAWTDQLAGARRTTREHVFTDTWFRQANRAAVYTSDRFCQVDFDADGTRELEQWAAERGRPRPPFPDACFDWRDDPDALDPMEDPELTARIADWRAARLRDRTGTTERVPALHLQDALRRLGYVEDD